MNKFILVLLAIFLFSSFSMKLKDDGATGTATSDDGQDDIDPDDLACIQDCLEGLASGESRLQGRLQCQEGAPCDDVDDASFALGWCSNECLGDEEDDGEDN